MCTQQEFAMTVVSWSGEGQKGDSDVFEIRKHNTVVSSVLLREEKKMKNNREIM